MTDIAKELEWTAIEMARSTEDPTPEPTGDYEASTPFGHYSIVQYFGSDSYGWEVVLDYGIVANKDDPEDAKAAGQAHFEARLRASLSPSAISAIEDREELVKALEHIERASSEVSRLGVVTGPQWPKLTMAILRARALLSHIGERP